MSALAMLAALKRYSRKRLRAKLKRRAEDIAKEANDDEDKSVDDE
jgi:hypothetical protein